jgi:hypothetical protein
MAIPVLKLNLAPPPSLWRRQHALLSWSTLGLGTLALSLAITFSWTAYQQANRMGLGATQLSRKTQEARAQQGSVLTELRAIDVPKELPRWKLAERILGERSSPWSRLTAELERSLVQDVRIRALQRSRGSDQTVLVKLKGEARTREAEAAFVASIQENGFFAQMILERETERQGGGIDFEYTLPLAAVPPPYTPLPKYGAARTPPTMKVAHLLPEKTIAPVPKAAVADPLPKAAPPLTPRSSSATPQPMTRDGEASNERPIRGLRRLHRENAGEPRRGNESERPVRELQP